MRCVSAWLLSQTLFLYMYFYSYFKLRGFHYPTESCYYDITKQQLNKPNYFRLKGYFHFQCRLIYCISVFSCLLFFLWYDEKMDKLNFHWLRKYIYKIIKEYQDVNNINLIDWQKINNKWIWGTTNKKKYNFRELSRKQNYFISMACY